MLAAIESKENILHKWNYKARKAGGEMARGVLEALTHADAVRELRRQGLAILEVQLGDAGASVGEAVSAKTQKRRLENAFRKDDTVSFCSQIAVMLRTGVTLKESLDTFAEQAARPVLRSWRAPFAMMSAREWIFHPPLPSGQKYFHRS